jgi:uncharacterized metal-binding protein
VKLNHQAAVAMDGTAGVKLNRQAAVAMDGTAGVKKAGEGTRTLDIQLGKLALYQLSYARKTPGL